MAKFLLRVYPQGSFIDKIGFAEYLHFLADGGETETTPEEHIKETLERMDKDAIIDLIVSDVEYGYELSEEDDDED